MERLDAFMARANAAYYATHDPFRDFVTAPELSQAFGEVLGLWASVVWRMMGGPAPVLLAEVGPGRGTLMQDALRAIRRMAPDFAAALSVHLIETSPALRASQAGRVPGAAWHGRVEDLPAGPLILLANEFLDALPIRQFVRRADGWRERFVEEGRFVELPADHPGHESGEGEVIEIGEAAAAVVAGLARRLAGQGGAALFIDYGPAASAPGDSLQALRGGRATDPLEAPGSADLTAHVDFQALAAAARGTGAAVQGPLPQGVFLARLGLMERSRKLAERLEPARAGAVMQAAQRLVAPELMGRLFKVLAVCHPGLPTLPGFEA